MEERYCQFGKRFLDGFSWIAPVTNNRLGDALNIEFVHEQLSTLWLRWSARRGPAQATPGKLSTN